MSSQNSSKFENEIIQTNFNDQSYITPEKKECEYITKKNKNCKNKVTPNGKCTFHNNFLNRSVSNIKMCRKLIFEECNGYNYNCKNKNIEKCTDTGSYCLNNKYYCNKHSKNYKLEIPEECAICTENICEKTEIPLYCGHWFHLTCCKHLSKFECPLCRKNLEYNEIDRFLKLKNMNCLDEHNSKFTLRIPENILNIQEDGVSFVQLLYLNIKRLYTRLNLNCNSDKINRIMLNIFRNNEYMEIAKVVYSIYIPICENGKITKYIVKNNINVDEDNYYTQTYDRFLYFVENLYNFV
jgi:hypothetical protein